MQFPIGVAGHQGLLRAAILPDPEVPVLLPASMLLKLGAVLNLPEKTIHWTQLGPNAIQRVHVLPSGHMAVDIMDFGVEPGNANRGPKQVTHEWMLKAEDVEKPFPSDLSPGQPAPYEIAMQELWT
eukprot:238623-Amphidinium_carterae.1